MIVFSTISLLESYMFLVLISSLCELFIKAGFFYSETLQIIYGFLQGSISGPLLFNVNLIDLFLAEHYKLEVSYYANNTTPYNCRKTFLETISDLKMTLENLLYCVCYKMFKPNVIYSYSLSIQSPLIIKVLK